jgi:Rap1a immunity proteins
MRGIFVAAALASGVFAWAPTANADADPGFAVQDLYRQCQAVDRFNSTADPSPTDAVDAVACVSYVRGWVDALYLMRQDCISGIQPNQEEIRLIFMRWVRENPEYLREHRGVGLGLALVSQYECNVEPNG